MNSNNRIIVSLTSFGAYEVRRHGQGWFVDLCRQAGADGVEIRGELLQGHATELDELACIVRDTGLDCVYSSPEMLWNVSGALDLVALDRGLASARTLNAPVLKMSIGGFSADSKDSFALLAQKLEPSGVRLLIENDQTVSAGSVHAMQAFFELADQVGLTLGMTFDMGNWHWVGECPVQAAALFAARVRYVHCKGVQRQPNRWVAVPLAESAAPWRSIFRAMPQDVPRAIEYPLMGEDLLAVTRAEIAQLRSIAVS